MGVPTPFPSDAAIKRAEALTRERFVLDGEDKLIELAPGTVRRRALDAALIDVAAKLPVPSVQWRQDYSLLLGLERVLSDQEPKLADGTVLSAHQVDALSGTLTALLAQSQAAEGQVPEDQAAAEEAGDEDGVDDGGAGSAGDRTAGDTADRDTGGDGEDATPSSVVALMMDEPLREHAQPGAEPDGAEDDGASEGPDAGPDDDEVEADEDDEPDEDDDFDEDFERAPDDVDEDDEDDEADDLDADEDDDEPDEDDEEPEDEPAYDDEADDEPADGDLEEGSELDEDVHLEELGDDPGADRRFWFEHATGAGKTVAALGFVEASRTGGVLILTHRRNLVDQFIGELKDRGYRDRLCKPLLIGEDAANGPVSVETYQWFVRNAGSISSAYTIVICDEAHTALGEKTSAAIRKWHQPIWIGMTATGALIARHVTDLFPTQTSRFDLAQAARRGVIAPLRCIRIPPGPGVRTIAKVPLRRGEVDTEFDQEMLAGVLDHLPFNLAIADLYKTRFNGVPGVVYAAGVRHAYNVAESFRDLGMKAMAVSGETPKRELAQILADYESGKIDVLVNAQLLAEGWNSPRATVCMHLAPTASKRIYQQRVGRVTRRHPGKEAGIVIDFVHPATQHDDPVVTLHSLLDRDVYRGGAIVVGPVRRGRGRRVRVERRVLPVTPDSERRAEVFERELWRIAVENLDYGEQRVWAALAGARVAPNGWRRAKAMLHFDRQGELKSRFLLTALQRNRSSQVRLRALTEIAAGRDADAFDSAIDIMAPWPRDERREGVKIMLLALAEKRIGRRDQASNWIWRMAEYTREVHEEYAVQRWPETKRLLGLLVNSSGTAHARNARRIVHATRKQDRRLSAALLAAAVAHSPEAAEALNGARTRMARKPATLARDLLRNFPKGKRSKNRKRNRKPADGVSAAPAGAAMNDAVSSTDVQSETTTAVLETEPIAVNGDGGAGESATAEDATSTDGAEPRTVARRTRRRRQPAAQTGADAAVESDTSAPAEPDASSGGPASTDSGAPSTSTNGAAPAEDEAAKSAPVKRTRRARAKSPVSADAPAKITPAEQSTAEGETAPAKRTRSSAKATKSTKSDDQPAAKPRRPRTTAKPKTIVVGDGDAARDPEPV